ncbi:MAG: glutaredoxin family protein [Candidatus Neomarinimicrobiota bacterium]
MKAWLSEKGIDYSERNIAQEDSALEELKNLGVFSTPATLIDNELIIGFDQRKFEELLDTSDET